ncbi:MAG TPA: hypothetical protein ENH15_00465 [Actinobacteria bacterium]|nr:hypothetical protein [Actinomycetota bacterium]
MTVDGDSALRADGHTDVAFCAPGCRTSFLKDPDLFPDRLETPDSSQSQCGCGNHESPEKASLAQTTDNADCCGGQTEGGDTVATKVSAAPAGDSGCCGGHGG